jgi:hypothetical protein
VPAGTSHGFRHARPEARLQTGMLTATAAQRSGRLSS